LPNSDMTFSSLCRLIFGQQGDCPSDKCPMA
jgi:hypothetical protein